VVGERCTALHGVPTHFLGVLSEVEKRKEADDAPNMYSLRFVAEMTVALSFLTIFSRTLTGRGLRLVHLFL